MTLTRGVERAYRLCRSPYFRASNLFSKLARRWRAFQPTRPIVLIQSDDWGRVGAFSPEAIDRLKQAGLPVGHSEWDYYGLESGGDLRALGDVLEAARDIDGNPACMTANIITANADLRRMRVEQGKAFRYVPISEGFPEPWENQPLVEEYRRLIDRGVFYPALHGFTHFSPRGMMIAWHDEGELGKRARHLFEYDVPYLASLTPEFNFALLKRDVGRELFADEDEQRAWIDEGGRIFENCFGMKPFSTCAPGYRANATTYRIWKERGVRVVQSASGDVCHEESGILFIPRTVFFEPGLSVNMSQELEKALLQADAAVSQGKPIVICSHSISYMQRHLNKRDESLIALHRLLTQLLRRYPDLRFANDQTFYDAWKRYDKAWFTHPDIRVRRSRML